MQHPGDEDAIAWRSVAPTVETVHLRDGIDLLVCRMPAGAGQCFVFDEPEDLVGLGFHRLGGARFALAGGESLTHIGTCLHANLPAGTHSAFSVPPAGFRTLSLRMRPDAATALLGKDFVAPAPAPALRCGRLLDANDLHLLDEALDSPYAGSARRLHLEAVALALTARQIGVERSASSTRHVPRAMRAREVLEGRLLDPPSLLELSRIVGLNDNTLKRVFKETFGVTVFGYVRQRLLDRAAQALRLGRPVSVAAHEAGYACRSRFAAAFRHRFGASPQEWRRSS